MERVESVRRTDPSLRSHQKEEITIVVVSCDWRLSETLNMVKSVLLFNSQEMPLNFIIITEDNLMQNFSAKLDDWKELLKDSFSYQLIPITTPGMNREEWIYSLQPQKPCTAQRIFLPSLLSHIDSVLYIDSDTISMAPVADAWKMFRQFNDSQIVGVTPEHDDSSVGWYNRFAKHPFYEPLGVNCGIMLMNLTRMRAFEWEKKIQPIYKEYRTKIMWKDQDLMNILFHFHPEKVYLLPCEWNYRSDNCVYMNATHAVNECKAPNGVKIVHGNREIFHFDHPLSVPAFRELYLFIDKYQIGSDPYSHFLLPLIEGFKNTSIVNTTCGKITDKFLYKARQMFKPQ
ncbi:glucoside xylosyltransferase 2-like [Phlebotomus argentipes]|uniref:glucoside xylosyltransferase 2-like n=1 Tax=Phlebotomus argentipes TaxID=94469 RepID=UPI002892CA2D|nr:glucoside xylosyltransferase 2-like [Phlebotomus argentipes]